MYVDFHKFFYFSLFMNGSLEIPDENIYRDIHVVLLNSYTEQLYDYLGNIMDKTKKMIEVKNIWLNRKERKDLIMNKYFNTKIGDSIIECVLKEEKKKSKVEKKENRQTHINLYLVSPDHHRRFQESFAFTW